MRASKARVVSIARRPAQQQLGLGAADPMGPIAWPSSSSTRTSASATSPVSDGRASTGGRRTAPAGDEVQVGEVGLAPGAAGRLGHVQAEGRVVAHR